MKFYSQQMTETQEAIVEYFKKFPDIGVEIPNFESLINCVALIALFQYFHGDELNIENISETAEKNDWFRTLKEVRSLVSSLEPLLQKSPYSNKKVDITALCRRGDLNALEELSIHLIYYSVISTKKKEAVEAIKQLSKEHQNVIKKIIKPDPSPAATPVKQEQQVSTPKSVTSSSASTSEALTELNSKIEALKASNSKLKSENDELRKEINELKEQTPDTNSNEEQEEVDVQKQAQIIASIKAQCFVLGQSKKQKTNRKNQLMDFKSHIPTLQENIEKAKNEIKELESKIDQNENKGPDYTVLVDRLQELRIDPKTKEANDILNEIKQLKRKLKDINKKRDLLQAKLDGQQGIAVLEDRKRFLQQLEIANQDRKKRAQLNLTLSQKKMRSEAFLLEMRSFI